jgi:hypothetical protein
LTACLIDGGPFRDGDRLTRSYLWEICRTRELRLQMPMLVLVSIAKT